MTTEDRNEEPDDDLEGDGSLSGADFLAEVAFVPPVEPPSPGGRAGILGERMGHFRVVSELGRGGMGIVYEAEDLDLGRPVALKLLPRSFANSEERRMRFLREARAAARVSHPNLATVYEVGEVDGRPFLAMELVRGEPLHRSLRKRRFSVSETLSIVRQLLAGLGHAHAAGLVHRDLKPENVLVAEGGAVKILDFGLAKYVSEEEEAAKPTDVSLTREGYVLGTPSYMAPEQARGLDVDARADIFSLGVVLYEMLSGERPFSGATAADVISAILRDHPEPVMARSSEVSASLSAVVERCLEKDPALRFPDCASIQDALDDVSFTTPSTGSGRSRASGHTPFVTSERSRPRISTADSGPGQPPQKKSRASVTAAAAGVALVAAGIAVWFWPKAQPASATSVAPPAPRATAVTDLPVPASSNPEARVAYAAAMQGFRDANWGVAEEELRKAVTKDPTMAAAYLRLSFFEHAGHKGTSYAIESFGHAAQSRANLTERDQVLMQALEPVLNRDPADYPLAIERLRAATQRYPMDAEFFHYLGVLEPSDQEAMVRAERRAVEIDPEFADAWQVLGGALARLNRGEEAMAALDRCVAISPTTADCRGERARFYELKGDCAKAEEEMRRGLSTSPRAVGWHDMRANAMAAVGRSPETILEAFRQKWAQMPEGERRVAEMADRAHLEIFTGDFAAAERHALEGARLVEYDLNADPHYRFARLLISIYRETGRPLDAARVAESYLARKDVWLSSRGNWDPTVPMSRVIEHAGRISHSEVAKRRDAWLMSVSGMPPGQKWYVGYVYDLETKTEAEEALAALGSQPPPFMAKSLSSRVAIGAVYLLADRPAEAVPLLAKVTTTCDGLNWPAENVRARYGYARALELTGDTPRACAEYGRVVEQWKGAKPRSLTYGLALARTKALACDGAPRGSSAPAAAAPEPEELWPHRPHMPPLPKHFTIPPVPPVPPGPPEPPDQDPER